MNGLMFSKLWDYCLQRKLRVCADVHTHPGSWTNQSESDRKYPVIAQTGHTAIIVPEFAQRKFQFYQDLGVYEYLGNKEWKAFSKPWEKLEITL